MKFFFGILGLLTGLAAVAAETAPVSTLQKSFETEYAYLISQKEALLRQRRDARQSFAARTSQAKAEVERLQAELARTSAQNDERHEDLAQLEKRKKDLQKRGTSLEATWKKSAKTLAEAEKALRFESSKESIAPIPPERLAVTDLGEFFARAETVLTAAGRVETFDGSYLDEEGRLAQGRIERLGRVAAVLKDGDRARPLGPSGTGTLQVLPKTEQSGIFFFENLSEAARVQHTATWVENLADASPAIFLALMLFLVAGLFAALVRI